jgi:predicted aminopeptidase
MGIKGFLRALLARLHMPRGGLTLQAVMVGVVVATVGGGGLQGCYLLKQGRSLLGYQLRARPTSHILAHPQTPDSVRVLIGRAQAIKVFATDVLGLDKNKNYTTFVPVARSSIVDVVTACAEDGFIAHAWRFPLLGRFAQKGFFDRADAQREARRLEKRGLDVYLRPAGAFSTLGIFRDPLYSYMSKYSEYSLANLIIHEQTHATLFLRDQETFNEQLATFVGDRGSLLYLQHTYGEHSALYQDALNAQHDEELFVGLLKALHTRLDSLYGSGHGREVVVGEKKRIIEAFKQEFSARYDTRFLTPAYRTFVNRTLNNAVLVSYMTYVKNLELFYQLYQVCGEDLPRTIGVLRQAAGHRRDPEGFIRSQIVAQSAAGVANVK